MEFSIYIETENDFEPSDVVDTLHKIFKLGIKAIKEDANLSDKNLTKVAIAIDLDKNNPTIERADQ